MSWVFSSVLLGYLVMAYTAANAYDYPFALTHLLALVFLVITLAALFLEIPFQHGSQILRIFGVMFFVIGIFSGFRNRFSQKENQFFKKTVGRTASSRASLNPTYLRMK